MDSISKEMPKEIKEERKIEEQKLMDEMESFDLNSLFTFGINFDMLKLVINNLIKSNHKINYKLSELKFDKINSEQRADQLELEILELKIAKEKSPKEKKLLQEQKSKLLSKNYKSDIDLISKEKEYYSNSLNNLNKDDSYKLDKIINNITKFKLGTESSSKPNDEIMKKIEENNKKLIEENNSTKRQIEYFKNKINNDINKKIEEISSKIEETNSHLLNNDKEFISIKELIKTSEEEMQNKLTKEFQENIDNLLTNKISELDSKISQIEQQSEEKLKEQWNKFRENINNLQKIIDEKNIDTENKILRIKVYENNLSEKIKYITNEQFKEYVPLKIHKQFQEQIEDKLLSNYNQQSTEIEVLNNSITTFKNKVNEFMENKTDHNNLSMLLRKFESTQSALFRANSVMEDYEKEKKRLQNLDPKKIVSIDLFEELKLTMNKSITNFQKQFQDLRAELLDKNSKFFVSQASLKDLKNLEDDLLSKMDDLYSSVNGKFAQKNLIVKNNKILELKMKSIVENYKKNEKSDSWILSKIPIGHLCASCESYLGDIRETNSTKYIPWNKIPQKDTADKLYRLGSGYSRMIQMLSPDTKNKTKNSTNSNIFEQISPIAAKNRKDSLEDKNEGVKNKNLNNSAINTYSNQEKNNKKIQSFENQPNVSKYKLPNLLKVKQLKKNSTFSNIYSENLDEQNKTINNTGINFNKLGVNNKGTNNYKNKNEEIEKDEIIRSPLTVEKKNDEKRGPKIVKVIKKK